MEKQDNLLDSECIRVIGDSISNSFLNSIDLDVLFLFIYSFFKYIDNYK